MSDDEANHSAAQTSAPVRPGSERRFGGRRRFVLLVLVLVFAAAALGALKYYRFYYHVTQQEVLHSVQHDTFEATIRASRSVRLQIYQQANASSQQLVLFTSGDGGWSPFCADIAAHVASTGRTVVGFDSKDYLTTFSSSDNPVSPEQIARDYEDVMSASRRRAGVNSDAPIVLSGWSLGAGYSILAASAVQSKASVDRVVAISLPLRNELAWKASDALIYITHGTPHEKVFDSRDYIARLGKTPVAILNASDDDNAPVKDAQLLFDATVGPRKLFVIKASGHHFEGGEQTFYQRLDDAFDSNLSFEPSR